MTLKIPVWFAALLILAAGPAGYWFFAAHPEAAELVYNSPWSPGVVR